MAEVKRSAIQEEKDATEESKNDMKSKAPAATKKHAEKKSLT